MAKSTENVVIVNTEKENKSKSTKANVKSHSGDKKNIIWFGTSISKALDRNKFEEDTQTKMKFVKAFGIKAEGDQFFPELNVTDTVNKVLEKDEPQAIILQAGSIEISNIDVKQALMDTEKDIEQYKKDWAAKVEEDSANLYDVAVKAIEKNPTMKVVIVKRLPRYDPDSSDPKQIKSQLSRFGNDVYDQLWFKGGSPKNIYIVDFELNCSSSGYLKDLIYGQITERNYDGIHLRGGGAQRHFTYRAVNAIKPILRAGDEQLAAADNHTNCPQHPV